MKKTIDESRILKVFDEFDKETNRGCVLVALAHIEELLREILYAFFTDNKATTELIDGFNAPLGTLASKSKACFALGLITKKEYKTIEYCRKIRNIFAHSSYGVSFNEPSIIKLCKKINIKNQLKDIEISGNESLLNDLMRTHFLYAISVVSLRLMYRHLFVSKEKRNEKEWELLPSIDELHSF